MSLLLPNREDALSLLSNIDAEELPPEARKRFQQSIEALRLNPHEPGAYIPRDPVVSILLSHLTADRSVQDAVAALSAASLTHPFRQGRAPRVHMNARARLVVVGDWGSGIPRALDVALQMRKSIDVALRDGREVHVLSLGDVYYSGLPFEYTERFLPHWPVRTEEANVLSWALNGNHDMYADGRGFFETLLGDPRFAAQSGSSYFALENEFWQLVGLDTAYAPPDESGSHANLFGDQAGWLKDLRDTNRRTMLFSHHPLFSAFDSTGPLLQDALQPVFAQGPIDAWFWGHEHRCAVYRSETGPVRFAGLVGHGGIPMPTAVHENGDETRLIYHYRDEYEPGLTLCGFAEIDLDEPQASVRFYNERGECHYETPI